MVKKGQQRVTVGEAAHEGRDGLHPQRQITFPIWKNDVSWIGYLGKLDNPCLGQEDLPEALLGEDAREAEAGRAVIDSEHGLPLVRKGLSEN